MKYRTTIALHIILFVSLLFCLPKNEISSTITEVTIYNSGAMVEREAEVTLSKGVSTIVFTELPEILDNRSLTISKKNKSKVKIYDYNFIKEVSKSKKLVLLFEEIEKLEKKERKIKEQMKTMVSKSDFYRGLKVGINRVLKKNYSAAFGIDIKKIENMIFKGIEEEYAISNILGDSLVVIKKRIEEIELGLDSMKFIPMQSLVANVQTDIPEMSTFVIKYFIPNAGWYPFYNVNIIPERNISEVKILATIYQETGEDWTDVSMTVSNETPAKLESIPTLNKPYIWRHNPRRIGTDIYKNVTVGNDENVREFILEEFDVTDVQRTFKIDKKYTLKSGERELKVKLESKDIKTKYKNVINIHKNSTVNHIANIINSSNQILSKGNVNLFLKDEFKGKDIFNELLADDSVSYHIGKDNNISVILESVKKETEEPKIFSTMKIKKELYEYKIKNHGKNSRYLTLINYIPTSRNEKVTIKMIDDIWKHDPKTGKLETDIVLKVGEEVILPMGFTIEFPSNVYY